jgi:hypothetical protein
MTFLYNGQKGENDMTSGADYGLPVAAAIDATLAWVNDDGDEGVNVFQRVVAAIGQLEIGESQRQQARGWLKAVGKAAAKNRRRPDRGRGMPALLSVEVRREIWAELQVLTGAFSLQPKLTTKGLEYRVIAGGSFFRPSPLTWASLAVAELMTDPDKYHFLMCPGCNPLPRFSVDIREGRGKRRGRFCSLTCQRRVGQREKRARATRARKAAGRKAKPARRIKKR